MFWIKNINTMQAVINIMMKASLQAAIDVVALEKALENENNTSISNLNTRKINAEKWHQLQQLGFKQAILEDYFHKLREYRYVDDLNGLLHGSYIRWIDLKNPENDSFVHDDIKQCRIGMRFTQ